MSGVLALILAAVGIYSVVGYAVARRTHEIGIRMALGADGGCILRMLLWHGVSTVGIGLGLGLGSALALTCLISGFLYGVPSYDPVTFCGILLTDKFLVGFVPLPVPPHKCLAFFVS